MYSLAKVDTQKHALKQTVQKMINADEISEEAITTLSGLAKKLALSSKNFAGDLQEVNSILDPKNTGSAAQIKKVLHPSLVASGLLPPTLPNLGNSMGQYFADKEKWRRNISEVQFAIEYLSGFLKSDCDVASFNKIKDNLERLWSNLTDPTYPTISMEYLALTKGHLIEIVKCCLNPDVDIDIKFPVVKGMVLDSDVCDPGVQNLLELTAKTLHGFEGIGNPVRAFHSMRQARINQLVSTAVEKDYGRTSGYDVRETHIQKAYLYLLGEDNSLFIPEKRNDPYAISFIEREGGTVLNKIKNFKDKNEKDILNSDFIAIHDMVDNCISTVLTKLAAALATQKKPKSLLTEWMTEEEFSKDIYQIFQPIIDELNMQFTMSAPNKFEMSDFLDTKEVPGFSDSHFVRAYFPFILRRIINRLCSEVKYKFSVVDFYNIGTSKDSEKFCVWHNYVWIFCPASNTRDFVRPEHLQKISPKKILEKSRKIIVETICVYNDRNEIPEPWRKYIPKKNSSNISRWYMHHPTEGVVKIYGNLTEPAPPNKTVG